MRVSFTISFTEAYISHPRLTLSGFYSAALAGENITSKIKRKKRTGA
ncbi:hypothetical protein CYPRO_0281 [Cyclonatronum proteinivorum]|uniref:Uncharacterized protein n=1 Tax=Cyclonatronum proteinivorum TaxID=1457365 RepID=A0A345UGG7_9BACT|nr:hypothetical protein CYPRO_0281 [Cyclonatronum proteinivorum]